MNHETATENFFATGIDADHHGHYLNFGLWEDGITEYLEAAEHLLLRVGNKIELNSDSHLLDVGCGMGLQDLFFIKQFGCQSIEALDLTEAHLQVARNHNGHPKVNYVKGNACHLDYPDNNFTHVTGIEAPVNFNTREDFFREAYRVLKPNGKLGISDFCLNRPFESSWEEFIVKLVAKIWHIPFQNIDTPFSYAKKLMDQGFTGIEWEIVSQDVIPGYLADQFKPETLQERYRLRGQFWGRVGTLLDYGVKYLYRHQLLDYILISAVAKK